MTWPEAKKLIYDRYPVTEKEMTCWQEKQRRNELREAYKKRLMCDPTGKNKVCGEIRSTNEEVREAIHKADVLSDTGTD